MDRIHDSADHTGPKTIFRVFEEVNHDPALAFGYRWSPSERFGFVRRAELEYRSETAESVAVPDGIRNLASGTGRPPEAPE